MATLAERIVEEAADAVVVVDAEERIILWNRAAERLFGFPRDEAVGRRLSDVIVPEKHRARHTEGFRRVALTGETRYGTELLRVPARRRDGGQVSIAFTISLLKGPAGRVEAMAAVIRDETARWREERALRDRLRELEHEREARLAGGQASPAGGTPPA